MTVTMRRRNLLRQLILSHPLELVGLPYSLGRVGIGKCYMAHPVHRRPHRDLSSVLFSFFRLGALYSRLLTLTFLLEKQPTQGSRTQETPGR